MLVTEASVPEGKRDAVTAQLESWRRTVAYLEREAVNHQDKGRVRQALDAVERAARLRENIRRYES